MSIGVPITHRRLLKGEAGRWFTQDLIPPLLAATLLAGLGRMLISTPSGTVLQGAEIAIVYLLAMAASIAATKDIRKALAEIFPNPLRS